MQLGSFLQRASRKKEKLCEPSIKRLAFNENLFFFLRERERENVGVDLTKHVREHLGASD